MSYLSLLNAAAQVVGGTNPTLAQMQASTSNGIDATKMAAQQPYWFSGTDSLVSDGVAGLTGCYSIPTEVIGNTPVAMIMPDGWEPSDLSKNGPRQGRKYRADTVHVRVFTGGTDMQTALAQLVNFADTVTDAFDHHMTLLGTANVNTADCSAGRFLEVNWGGTAFFAVEFTVKVQRAIAVTYS